MNRLIENIEKYVPISQEEKELLFELFTEMHVSKNDKILCEGEVCKYLFFVSKGLFRHTISDENSEQTIHFSSQDSFICDFNSFTANIASFKNIEALEDSLVFKISKQNLETFYEKVKYGERFGRLLVENVFNETIKHIYSLKNNSPEERYEYFVRNFRDIHQKIPQYYVASYIGVTPQSLSRIRKRIITHH